MRDPSDITVLLGVIGETAGGDSPVGPPGRCFSVSVLPNVRYRIGVHAKMKRDWMLSSRVILPDVPNFPAPAPLSNVANVTYWLT